MVRPRVARGFVDLAALRSCINVSGLFFSASLLRRGSPEMADIVAKRFLMRERRTVSRAQIESGILIHRIGDSDSIIPEFPWPVRSSGTFATISARRGSAHPGLLIATQLTRFGD